MEESEILENMKEQSVVEVKCMSKLDANVRTKTGLCFFTFALNKIADKVNIGYELVQQ